jgi:hypothetical protein
MKSLLIKFALFIFRHYLYRAFMIPPEMEPIIADAIVEADKWNRTTSPGTSGEFKRHQCYGYLLKKYPKARNRDVAIAIELAIQGMKS